MRIDRPGGGEVPLSLVATLTEKQELAELTRIDGKPAVFVEAKADSAVITPIQARRLIIGIGGSLAAPPLPHHRAYGSVHGGSTDLSCGPASQRGEADPFEDGVG